MSYISPYPNPPMTFPEPERRPFMRVVFPLTDGNSVEINLKGKVSRSDFERIKKLVDLLEPAVTETGESK